MADYNSIYVHQNHNQQEIRNFAVEQLNAHPTGSGLYESRLWSITSDDRLYRYAGGAIKQIVEASDLNRFGIFVGVHDASTGVPTSGGSGVDGNGDPLVGTSSIQAGDYWRISVAGTLVGIVGDDELSVGDLLISTVDGATSTTEFLGIQKNIDDAAIINGSGISDFATRWVDATTLGVGSSRDDGTTASFGASLDPLSKVAIASPLQYGLNIASTGAVTSSVALKVSKVDAAINSYNTDLYMENTSASGTATGIRSVTVANDVIINYAGVFIANGGTTSSIGVSAWANSSTGSVIGGQFAGTNSIHSPSSLEGTSFGLIASAGANTANLGNAVGLKVFNKSSHVNDNYGLIIDTDNSGSGNSWGIQIKDTTQGEGKVLTSDADGKATWSSISSEAVMTSYDTVVLSNYTPTTDTVILCDTTSNSVTIDLPVASNSAGKKYIIKRVSGGTNNVIIDPNGGDTIDGLSTVTLFSQYDNVVILCNGTEWFFIG